MTINQLLKGVEHKKEPTLKYALRLKLGESRGGNDLNWQTKESVQMQICSGSYPDRGVDLSIQFTFDNKGEGKSDKHVLIDEPKDVRIILNRLKKLVTEEERSRIIKLILSDERQVMVQHYRLFLSQIQ